MPAITEHHDKVYANAFNANRGAQRHQISDLWIEKREIDGARKFVIPAAAFEAQANGAEPFADPPKAKPKRARRSAPKPQRVDLSDMAEAVAEADAEDAAADKADEIAARICTEADRARISKTMREVLSAAKPGAATPATKAPSYRGKYKAMAEAAERGELPEVPDFSAATHARFRKKLREVVALAEAGDLDGLLAYPIKPLSSSRRALDRYRNMAVTALQARARKAAA